MRSGPLYLCQFRPGGEKNESKGKTANANALRGIGLATKKQPKKQIQGNSGNWGKLVLEKKEVPSRGKKNKRLRALGRKTVIGSPSKGKTDYL